MKRHRIAAMISIRRERLRLMTYIGYTVGRCEDVLRQLGQILWRR